MHRMRRYNRHVRLVGYCRIGSLHQLRNRSQCRNRRKLHHRSSSACSPSHSSTSSGLSTCGRCADCTSRSSSTSRSCRSCRSFGQRRSKGLVLSGSTGSFQTTNPSFPGSGKTIEGTRKRALFFANGPLAFVATMSAWSCRVFSNWDYSQPIPTDTGVFSCPTNRLPPRSHR